MLDEYVFPKSCDMGIDVARVYFQQDEATARTARLSVGTSRQFLQHRIISRFGDVPRPARSLDLTACDLSLWGYHKHKVFETRPPYSDTLEQRIVEEINAIQAATLLCVMGNVVTRVRECIERDGQHLSGVILKKKQCILCSDKWHTCMFQVFTVVINTINDQRHSVCVEVVDELRTNLYNKRNSEQYLSFCRPFE
jgi:hypothetical protein